MNIGLIDIDGHNFPNIPLMKISSYHKNKGDNVEIWNGLKYYDKVYMSRIFNDTYSSDMEFCVNADEIEKGGTGYAIKTKSGKETYDKCLDKNLPREIEHQTPDYSLYNIKNTAYGHLTRGCPRNCTFCIVGGKEGLRSVCVSDLNEFWTGQREIKLLDPNITANKDCERLFEKLVKSKSWIDFTQGLDIRCMTDKKSYLLNKMKLKMIHFAWDNYEFETYEKLKYFRKLLKYDSRKLRVYVLTNFGTTAEQDLERIYKLKEMQYDPYVMIYNKPQADKETRRMARWVNNKIIFRSCEKFEDYQI